MDTPAKIINNLRNELIGQSALPMKESLSDTELSTWSSWLKIELPDRDKELIKLVEKTAAMIRAFRDDMSPRWLTLMGKSGTGKTHCAWKAWNFMRHHANWSGTYYLPEKVYWPKFVTELRSGTEYERFRDMMSWPALFLDDIGAERDTTGFASEQLNTILGCRENKWTIITSNLLLSGIGGIDPRMADRIIRSPNIYGEIKTMSYSERR